MNSQRYFEENRKKRLPRVAGMIAGILTVLTIATLAALTLLLGCDVGMNMTEEIVGPKEESEKPTEPTTTGEIKQPEETTPDETEESDKSDNETVKPEEPPTPPADTAPPTVVEVGWYSDQQRAKLLTVKSTVRPGDTIYTLVVFSEPVRHIVADDETARPALSIVIDGMATQYKILPHGVSFRSGEVKPLRGNTDRFLCRYTIPTDTVGTLALRVEVETDDIAGNTVTEASEHVAPFIIAETMIPDSEEPTLTTLPTVMEEKTPEERAEEIVRRIMHLKNEEPYNSNYSLGIEMLERESGLDYYELIYGTLYFKIYLEERPEDREIPFSWHDTVLEYLRLTFAHPEATEAEILNHFRQSVREGRVEVDINKSAFIQRARDEQSRLQGHIPDAHETRQTIWNREIKALKKKAEDPSFDINAELDRIFREEADISFDFAHNTLLRIHLEEYPDDQKVVDSGLYRYGHLISIYLLYKKTYEEESEEQILERIRKASGRGGVIIRLGAPLHEYN